MNSKTLKPVLMLILLVFLAVVMGAGYFYTVSQENKIREREVQVESLKKDQLALKEDFDKIQKKEEEAVLKNRDLQNEIKLFNDQKKVVLDQVRESVTNFEAFRVNSTEEIEKLKSSVTALEADKKAAEEKLALLEMESVSEKERLTGEVSDLTARIGELRSAGAQLAENLRNTDKVSMAAETAKLHYNLGNFYFKNVNYAAAAAEYKKALYYRPDDADANYNLAIVSDQYLDDVQTAIFRYKRYLELKPKASDRKKVLQRVLDLQLRVSVVNEKPKKTEHPVFKGGDRDVTHFNPAGDKR